VQRRGAWSCGAREVERGGGSRGDKRFLSVSSGRHGGARGDSDKSRCSSRSGWTRKRACYVGLAPNAQTRSTTLHGRHSVQSPAGRGARASGGPTACGGRGPYRGLVPVTAHMQPCWLQACAPRPGTELLYRASTHWHPFLSPESSWDPSFERDRGSDGSSGREARGHWKGRGGGGSSRCAAV
jgi:hypothetical protein